MKSHDFLQHYQLRTVPVKVTKESENGSVSAKTGPTQSAEVKLEVTQTKVVTEHNIPTGESSQPAVTGEPVCELKRRKSIAVGSDQVVTGAGYFSEHWRLELCQCGECQVSLHV